MGLRECCQTTATNSMCGWTPYRTQRWPDPYWTLAPKATFSIRPDQARIRLGTPTTSRTCEHRRGRVHQFGEPATPCSTQALRQLRCRAIDMYSITACSNGNLPCPLPPRHYVSATRGTCPSTQGCVHASTHTHACCEVLLRRTPSAAICVYTLTFLAQGASEHFVKLQRL